MSCESRRTESKRTHAARRDNCAGAAFNETSPVQQIAGLHAVFIHHYFILLMSIYMSTDEA